MTTQDGYSPITSWADTGPTQKEWDACSDQEKLRGAAQAFLEATGRRSPDFQGSFTPRQERTLEYLRDAVRETTS